MSPDLIQRYQPGGDIYLALQSKYGTSGANTIAAAATSGDESAINAALTQVAYGNRLNTSTASIFAEQIASDPLGAPLDDLNKTLGNTLFSFLRNKYVLGLIIGGGIIYLAGIDEIKLAVKKLLK